MPFGMVAAERFDLVDALAGQDRADGIDELAVRPHMLRRLAQQRRLRYAIGLELRGGQAPFRIRLAAPGAGPAARRIDQHAVEGAERRRVLGAELQPLDDAGAAAREPWC